MTINNLTREQRRELCNREGAKLEGKVSIRIYLLLLRCYLYGDLTKPIEQVTDEELLSYYGVGPKTLAEIRKVVPAPGK